MRRILILCATILLAVNMMAALQIRAEEEDTIIHSVELLAAFPGGGEAVPDCNDWDTYFINPEHPLYNRLGQVYVPDSAHYEIVCYSYYTSTLDFIYDPFFVTDSVYEMEIIVWPKKGYVWECYDSLAAHSTINGQPIEDYGTNNNYFYLNVFFKAQPVNRALSGRFTVDDFANPQVQVQFANGNLQYRPSTRTWRFSCYQEDVRGDDNSHAAADYDGWIDLFGWGASGYNGLEPYTTTEEWEQYCNLSCLAGTDYDWAKVAADSMGLTGTWRSLTRSEWETLFKDRPNASNLMGNARIDNTKGLLLLPDDWDIAARPLNKETNTSYTVLSGPQWLEWQSLGAVFLPCAGTRYGTDVLDANQVGYYWSADDNGEKQAIVFDFSDGDIGTYATWKDNGHSVRAVRIVENNPTGINRVDSQESKVESRKILRNGQLLILRGEKVYTLQGQEVR